MGNISEQFVNLLRRKVSDGVITKKELADRTGLYRSKIDRYLAGVPPRLDDAELIARAFGLSLCEFLDITPAQHTLADCLRNVADNVDQLRKK